MVKNNQSTKKQYNCCLHQSTCTIPTVRKCAVASCLMLTLFSTACTKEDTTIVPLQHKQSVAVTESIHLCYTVNGEYHSITVNNQEELKTLIYQLFSLATKDNTITLGNESTFNSRSQVTKEVVTFQTKNKDDMYAWIILMQSNNYQIVLTYDEETGVYTGTARR